MVYGGLQQQTAKLTNSDPARASEILNGVILLSFGLVWSMLARIFSYAPFARAAWMISGVALSAVGLLLIINQNPFRDNANFDLTGYQA